MFYDHWADQSLVEAINDMLAIRKRNEISSKDCAVHIQVATAGVYAAHVGHSPNPYTEGLSMDVDTTRPSICMKIGHGEWSPNSKSVGDLSWQCKASGDGWAIWEDKRFAE